MENAEEKRNLPDWSALLVLAVVCIGAFGVMLPRLGFYWDDWAKLLVSRLFGLSGYWAYYAEDRPLSGWTHILLTPLLGPNPITWQFFVLFLRWSTAAAAWWTMRILWPERRRQAFYAALLLVIYPVFTQQSIALTFHQQWLQYALYFISTAVMLLSLQHGKRGWIFTFLALAAMAIELSVTEYFVGLEALRIVILWFAVARSAKPFKQKVARMAKYVWPYLLLLAAYVIWRLFFIRLTGEDPYRAEMLMNLFNRPLTAVRTLVQMVAADSLYVLLGSWGQVVGLGLERQGSLLFTIFVWAAGILTGVVSMVYLFRVGRNSEVEPGAAAAWYRQALIVGVLGLLLGCLPGWATNRPVIFDFHSNRYAMPAMFGAALVWAVILDWLVQRRLQKAALIGGVVAAASIFHLYVAADYAQIWKNQLDFYWQLYWRAPAIRQGTAVLGENELFPNQGSFSTSAAINLLYPQDKGRKDLAYWYYNLQPRFAIEPSESPLGIPLRTQFRTLTYEGTTGESLVIFYDPGRSNCLWMLGAEDVLNPDLPDLTRRMLPASDLNRIQPKPVNDDYPDERMFGKEPEHSWCYYYQKADLATWQEDWKTAEELADEVRANPGFYPKNPIFKTPHEWIPFIKAYAHTGRWRDAQEITIQAANVYQARYRDEFCGLWKTLLDSTEKNQARDEAQKEVWTEIKCDN